MTYYAAAATPLIFFVIVLCLAYSSAQPLGDKEPHYDIVAERTLNDELVERAKMSTNDILARTHREKLKATCLFHANRMADEAASLLGQVIARNTSANMDVLPTNFINYPYPHMWFKCGNTDFYSLAHFVKTLCTRMGFLVKCNSSDTWIAKLPDMTTALYINVTVFLFDPMSGMVKPPCTCHWTDPDAVIPTVTSNPPSPPPPPPQEAKKPVTPPQENKSPFPMPVVNDGGIHAPAGNFVPKKTKKLKPRDL